MVARIPEATPRYFAGTEFMTAAMLGELNIPMPKPKSTRISMNGR